MIVATTGKNLRRASQFDNIDFNRKGKIRTDNKNTYTIYEVDTKHFDSTNRSPGLSPFLESLGEDLAFAYTNYVLTRTSRSAIETELEQLPIF